MSSRRDAFFSCGVQDRRRANGTYTDVEVDRGQWYIRVGRLLAERGKVAVLDRSDAHEVLEVREAVIRFERAVTISCVLRRADALRPTETIAAAGSSRQHKRAVRGPGEQRDLLDVEEGA